MADTVDNLGLSFTNGNTPNVHMEIKKHYYNRFVNVQGRYGWGKRKYSYEWTPNSMKSYDGWQRMISVQ